MAGHAQLKFVMTECSKTQIRLTRLIYGYCDDSIFLFHEFNVHMQIHQISLNHKIVSDRSSFYFRFHVKIELFTITLNVKK